MLHSCQLLTCGALLGFARLSHPYFTALEMRPSFERYYGLAMILWSKCLSIVFGRSKISLQSSNDATYHLPQAQEGVALC